MNKTLIAKYVPIVLCGIGGYCVVRTVARLLGSGLSSLSRKRMLSRWSRTPKDVVVVHKFRTLKGKPNASPFVIKLETYLKMARIPYEIDEQDPMGEKGKCPWISLNGVHITDSQLIIEYLGEYFDVTIGNYSEQERALSTMTRLVLDEHFYWGLLLWRYVYTEGRDCHKFFTIGGSPIVLSFFLKYVWKGKVVESSESQGVGRHSKEDVIQIMTEDLRTVSQFLGTKKFLLGDEPCEDDASVFGELAEVVWCCPNSPFEALLDGELVNLKEYCFRMKEKYWFDCEDWTKAV